MRKLFNRWLEKFCESCAWPCHDNCEDAPCFYHLNCTVTIVLLTCIQVQTDKAFYAAFILAHGVAGWGRKAPNRLQ